MTEPALLNVCAEMCETCVFHPGNKMMLQPGRLAGMVEKSQATDTYIVCHSTLDEMEEDEDGNEVWVQDMGGKQAVCRGYYDRYGAGRLGRIAERLGLLNLDFVPEET